MKLVVGLGNPGRKYEGTRHNVGFAVLAELARHYAQGKPRENFEGETVEAAAGELRLLLLCPHTFMNRSGQSVAKALDFYKLPLEDLLVVCDDFHLPLGKLRCRSKGSSGGQKGLQDIARHLGSEDFARLRIGVGEVPANWNAADFVLSRFSKQEQPDIDVAVARAADAAVVWGRDGLESCMNQFN
ncbi:MAG: aminoacyl-tRNA hydrolase [Pirellulales bacterium]